MIVGTGDKKKISIKINSKYLFTYFHYALIRVASVITFNRKTKALLLMSLV